MEITRFDISTPQKFVRSGSIILFEHAGDHFVRVSADGRQSQMLAHVANERSTADGLELYVVTCEGEDNILLCGGICSYLLSPDLQIVESNATGYPSNCIVDWLPITVAQYADRFVFIWDYGASVFAGNLRLLATTDKYVDDLLVQIIDESLVFQNQSDDELWRFYPDAPLKNQLPRIEDKEAKRESLSVIAQQVRSYMANPAVFTECDGILAYGALQDDLLRVVVLELDKSDNQFFRCYATYLPLYCDLAGFELTFAKEITRDSSMPKKDSLLWSADDAEALAGIIEAQAVPYLEKASDARTFALIATSLCDQRSSHVDEIVAISKAKGGDARGARIGLEWLCFNYLWQLKTEKRSHLLPFLKGVRTSKLDAVFAIAVQKSVYKADLKRLMQALN